MGKVNKVAIATLILPIRLYQLVVSPVLGNHCRFYPSCSEFCKSAIQMHGVLLGSWLSLKRIMSCHPWHEGGYNPVPAKKPKEKFDE